METLNQLIGDACARHPNRAALVIRPGFRTRTWRYRDLALQVPRVARSFTDRGLVAGDRVVIWAVNRPEWGIGFLSLAHAGLVAVPLDVRSTDEFAAKVVEQTEPRLVLASRQTEDAAGRLGPPVVLIESLPDVARETEPMPVAEVVPDDLLAVIFTSGTTGEPKGVMLSHRNVASNARTLIDVFPFGPDETLLSVVPLSHMFGLTCDMLAPLAAGKTVVYPVSRQPAVLIRTFRDFHITMLLIVPQGLRLLSNAIERKVDATGKRAQFERLHRIARRLPRFTRRLLFRPVLSQFGGRLRTFAIGASALEPDLARRWEAMGVECLQGYGATEMSPVISFTRPGRNRIGTVGEAIPGVDLRIADDGEVLVRGPNRFVGYWRNPEATAAAIDADGWYHTGDIGELDTDGFLTLRGRKKDMIALPDGQKVYPDDVEAVLARDQRIRDAAVVGLDGEDGGGARVHAVLLMDDPSHAETVVRDANARLAGHQQIRGWTVWPDEDFPRTPSMKVKKRLVLDRLTVDRASGNAAPASAGNGAPPSARPAVASVAALAAQVAQVPIAQVVPDARLEADLGLDSLGRIELLSVIEEELGAFIDDGQLDPDATVGDLERMVDAARDSKRDESTFGWPLHPAVRALGLAFQELLVVPFVGLFYRVRVRGEQHLRGLQGPVLFAPNHHLHTDNAIILTHLPLAWRWRLSVAAAADDIFGNPIRALGAAVIGNAFPLAREGAVRRSLELLGARLDRNFSVLIFPEGMLTVGGPMQPFKSGAGLIAVEGAIPVVPMKIRTNRLSWIDSRGPGTSLRGDVEVVFGEPMWFPAGTDAVVATQRLEAAVAAL